MVRVLCVAALLAGCRLRFDELPDAARDTAADASPLALACNTPVQIGAFTATNPRLTAATLGATLLAAWIGDDDIAVSAGVHFLAPDTVAPFTGGLMVGTTVGPVSAVSIVGGLTRVVAAATPLGSASTRVFVFDASQQILAMRSIDDFNLVSSRGVSAIRGGTPQFVIAGNKVSTARAVVDALNADGTPIGTQVDIGAADPRLQVTALDSGVLVEKSSAANNCTAARLDGDVTMHGAFIGWATAGQCLQAGAGYAPASGGTVLMARGDTVDGDINHAIGTLGANLTVTIPAESRLRTPATEGRITGAIGGFWSTYETGGAFEAAFVDLGGIVGVPKPLGPLASASAHEVVVRDADGYAVWIENGLWLARLCP